jgi:hypothetical protein
MTSSTMPPQHFAAATRMRVAAIGLALVCGAAMAQDDAAARARVEARAAEIAADLARLCPAAEPGDQVAFNACRRGLFGASVLRRSLPEHTLWGRQRDPKTPLKQVKLTQFAPDVLTGMYVPLFMFNGRHSVEYVAGENLYLIRLQTAFRNRLPPGQFPYPFWHDAEKWSMYERANELLLWWDAAADRVKLAQFTVFGRDPPIVATRHREHERFDGKWMWTDAQGRTQPMATLFDGQFQRDNPYLRTIEVAYRSFALKLRDGQCDQCHVPDNPDGMKKLVLLQTPAHAAAEIKRVLKAVREDKMPRDEFGIEQPLDKRIKAALLEEGSRFAELIEAAQRWEARMSVSSRGMPSAAH